MTQTRLVTLTAAEIASLVRARELSPVELVEAALEHISRTDTQVGAIAHLDAELAIAQAKRAAQTAVSREPTGPLLGVPVIVKDSFDTADMPTEAGSAVLTGRRPREDASAVTRLRKAGAIILGKSRLDELSIGAITPGTRNPWNSDRIAGGSSGGSAAAVAARMSPLALGADTGGSIRIPAAACGVIGLKPTYGRLGRAGLLTASWSLDTAGPIARTTSDIGLALGVLAGHDPLDPASVIEPVPDYLAGIDRPITGLRIGVPSDLLSLATPGVATAVETAARLLAARGGAKLVPMTVPLAEAVLPSYMAILLSEFAAAHQDLASRDKGAIGHAARVAMEAGRLVSAVDYVTALRARVKIKAAWRRTFRDLDLDAVITPTLPVAAPRISQSGDFPPQVVPFTVPANLTGLPALTHLCGFDDDNLPFGLQIIGRPFDEQTVLRVGYAYETRTTWATRVPAQLTS